MGAFVIVHDKIDSAGVVVGRRARVALDDLLETSSMTKSSVSLDSRLPSYQKLDAFVLGVGIRRWVMLCCVIL